MEKSLKNRENNSNITSHLQDGWFSNRCMILTEEEGDKNTG